MPHVMGREHIFPQHTTAHASHGGRLRVHDGLAVIIKREDAHAVAVLVAQAVVAFAQRCPPAPHLNVPALLERNLGALCRKDEMRRY